MTRGTCSIAEGYLHQGTGGYAHEMFGLSPAYAAAYRAESSGWVAETSVPRPGAASLSVRAGVRPLVADYRREAWRDVDLGPVDDNKEPWRGRASGCLGGAQKARATAGEPTRGVPGKGIHRTDRARAERPRRTGSREKTSDLDPKGMARRYAKVTTHTDIRLAPLRIGPTRQVRPNQWLPGARMACLAPYGASERALRRQLKRYPVRSADGVEPECHPRLSTCRELLSRPSSRTRCRIDWEF